VGTHGLKGALVVYSYTEPGAAIANYHCLRVGNNPEQVTPINITRCWQHGKRVLILLDGISDVETATSFVGKKLYISYQDITAEPDEYIWDDLIGCAVCTDEEVELGLVIELQSFGAQDILVVEAAKVESPGEWLIPFIEDVVLDVNIDKKKITIHLLEGMDACFTPKF